jgi:hypothetical protein
MSVEYIFWNKPITVRELYDETDFIIVTHKESETEWIVDSKETDMLNPKTNIRIKSRSGDPKELNFSDKIYELENHGFKNVDNIMDVLVSKLGVTFYTDNELENYYQLNHHKENNKPFPYPDMLNENGEFDFESAVIRDMEAFGDYDVLDAKKGIVILPTR